MRFRPDHRGSFRASSAAAVARASLPWAVALALASSLGADERGRVVLEFARELEPQPGGASDAVVGGGSLFLSDRAEGALIRYDESGREVARYQKGVAGPGSLTGHVFVALGGDGLFAWSSRGALMRFDATSLGFEREEKTGLAGAAGRFFHTNGRFYLVGPGWAREPNALDYFWSEADPPSARGEGRSVIWRLTGEGIGLRAMDLALRPLAARIPGGGFWVLRFDRYEVALVDEAGHLVQVLSLSPPAAFRTRTRPLDPQEVNPQDRGPYFRWLAEASVLVAPVALGVERLGIVRMEPGADGTGPPRWFLDVFDRTGRPLHVDLALPVSGRCLLGLQGVTSTSFQAVEMSKDLGERGAEHRWLRFRLPDE